MKIVQYVNNITLFEQVDIMVGGKAVPMTTTTIN